MLFLRGFPPTSNGHFSWQELCLSFNDRHSERGSVFLTVGARAFSKHCLRSTDGWWGSHKGSDPEKNKRANEILLKLLRDSIWLNAHLLPVNILL